MDARTTLIAIVVLCSLTSNGFGQSPASPESKAWWNPMQWGSDDSSPTRSSSFGTASNDSSASMPKFSLPKMPWSGEAKAIQKSAKSSAAKTKNAASSTFNQIGQSTKKAWNNTLDFLNPFDGSNPLTKKSDSFQQGFQQQGYQPQNMKSETKSGGMFGWMFTEKKMESPGTVGAWMSQERPRF